VSAAVLDRPLHTLVHPSPRVPLLDGSTIEQAYLDHAASAAPLIAVADEVAAFLASGQYAAVHRGMGFTSQWCTDLYEDARAIVRAYLGAPDDAHVIWTHNTTGAINTAVHAFGPDAPVVAFAFEHHANLLPWQLCDLVLLPVPPSPDALLAALEAELIRRPAELVVITGASNVTGECPPLAQIATLAHHHGARVLVDGAQWAAHHPVNMVALGIDWVALSGHKLGAPLGVGVLVGPTLPTGRAPFMRGGAAVDFVLPDGHAYWLDHPEHRHEAGSPNVVGVLATAVAMATLIDTGMNHVAMAERMLTTLAAEALTGVLGDRIVIHRMWPGAPRIGVLTFALVGIPYALLAARLSAEFGIATRHGCFCAHPLVAHLHGIDLSAGQAIAAARHSGGQLPGAVRVSFGLDSTFDTVLRLIEALLDIVKRPSRWDYQLSPDGADCVPVSDPRRGHRLAFTPPCTGCAAS
jgi:selenocysteine lyase/cysteine desulfurase